MPIKIKLLVLLLLLAAFGFARSTATANALENNAASTDGQEVISDNEDGEIENDRSKRLYTEKIRESLDKIKVSLEKSITDKLDSPILSSIRDISLLKGKSKVSSLLDTYKQGSRGISLAPSPCQHQILPTQEIIPAKDTLIGNVALSSIDASKTPSKATDEATLGAAHGPVVLPDYLIDKNEVKKNNKPSNPNRITMQQLREASDLRKEINYAVKHGIYVHSASEVKNMNQQNADVMPSPQTPPPQYLPPEYYAPTTPAPSPPQYYTPQFPQFNDVYSNFWQNLFGSPRKVAKTREQTVGSVRSDFSFVPDDKPSMSPDEQLVNHLPNEDEHKTEHDTDDDDTQKTIEKMMAKAAEKMMSQGIVSNTVESYANSDDAPYIELNRVREELNITSVTEDMRFTIGENVIGWRTLQRNQRESHALIGITNTSVLLVLERNGVYKLQVEKHLLSSPTFFITFTYWNQTQQSIDGMVIVSIQHEIVFLRVNEAMDKMEVTWIWPTNNIARYLHHLVIDNSDTLLIITDLHEGSAASLYRFDMNEEVFFLRQSLSLKTRALNMALIQNGFDTFMCFPQKGHAVIYKYHKDHFRYYTKIESHNANILSAFEMGGHSYLTIGGSNAKILRYHRGTFQDQTILSKSWGNVEFFLPVPARTYRDDLILFVQHRMDYGSHTNSYLEALIWNGQAFHPALEVPCYINEHESDLGLGCMLDEDRDLGIIGATMFQRNRSISIIVPRHQAPSGLFDLEIDLLPAASTLNEHLLEMLSEVMIMLDIRDQVLTEARELIDNFPKDTMEEVTIRNQDLDIIYTQDLDLGSLIPTDGIFLGNELITKKTADDFVQFLNKTETNLQLLEQLKRNKRENTNIIEHLHLKSINVNELNVRHINNVSAEDLVFVEDGNLKLSGTVLLSQPIEPNSVVDDIDPMLGQEVPDITNITFDMKFEEINGIKWRNLLNEIVLMHLSHDIDDMEVLKEIRFDNSVNAQHLNDIPFPSGYILTNTMEGKIVTGKTVFKNVLVARAFICGGAFNGIQLSDVVTLNSTQFIPGTTTFRHLEVTDTLDMAPNATISGRRLDEFLSNPSLIETKQIHSTVYFDTLEIEGPLYVRNLMDNVFLDEVLRNVVYKHESAPQVNSFKRFESIQAPNIQLTTNLINGIPFSSFVTSDTEQTFDVSKLHGNFYFQKLKLDGLFNFINVTELDLSSLKLLGEQFTDAEFVFVDGDYINIDANQLEVLQTMNGIDVSDFISIDEDFHLNSNVHVDSLKVGELILDGDVKGSSDSLVNGFNLQNLLDTHLSKNSPQNITGSVFIPTAVLRNGIDTDFINGFDFKETVDILKNLKTNEQMLNESSAIVDQLIVNGSVWFADVNGFDLEHIKANAIRLDQSNNLSFPIVFLDSVYVNGNIDVVQLNGEQFTEFAYDLVLKSAEFTKVYGTTVFEEDVTILYNADVTTINEIQVRRILTKNYNRTIFNPIRIIGDVTIPNLIVKGRLNGVPAEDLNSYHFDSQSGARFVLKKNIFFNETIDINYLNIHGGYDNIGNVNEHLRNIIRTDRPAVITGRKTFTDSIHFEKGIDVVVLNEVNVPTFLTNIVMIDQFEQVDIISNIVFAAPVVIPRMKITGNLIAEMINNGSVVDWVQNTIRTDLPFDFDGVITFPDGTFEASNINTEFLNDNLIDDVITLNTEQTFDKPVNFNYIYSTVPITADGLVSGYDLPGERKNTLMVYGTQVIETPTVFQTVRVLKNLLTNGLVNGRDLRLAASLQQGNIVIDSPLSFGTVSVNKLYTSDLISGINFDNWFENALVRYKSTPQVVTAPWTIKNGIISTMNVAQGINDMDVNQYLQNLEQLQRQYQFEQQQKCQEAKQRKNIVFLSNFEKAFTISTENLINSIYLLNYFDRNYFVVNSGCQTFVYAWDDADKIYVEVNTANTGDVVEWIHVLDHDNQLFLIANNDGSIDSNCTISGAFIWKFNTFDNSLNQEVQFGRIGEFRSIQMKPNSHALFYVIRNSDSHLVEYDLRGAIVTEWNTDNIATPQMTPLVRFVRADAQFGLALSDGKQLSMLNPCNCTRRIKRCGILEMVAKNLTSLKIKQRENFEKSMKQLKSNLGNGQKILDITKKQQAIKENKDYAKISQASIDSIKENNSGSDTVAEMETEDNQGQLSSMLEEDDDSSSDTDSVDDILSMIAEAENISNGDNSNKKEEDPKVGDAFGDIMFKLTPVADKIIDKLMDKIRQKQYDDRNQYMLGSAQGAEDNADVDQFSSKISKFFQKVGNGVVKVYVYGRDHYRSAKKSTKSIATDIKHLYNVYYDEAKEYIHNKTSSDQADDENDSKEISKLMPNAKEFAKLFAVEMIKSFSHGGKPSDETKKNVWAMLKNGVKAAFDIEANDTHGHHHNGNETELNEKIYNEFLHELNETIINEEHKLETQPEEMVGSTLNEDQVGDSLSIDEPTYVFDRFTPLINYLSDKIVDKLLKQQKDSINVDNIGNDTETKIETEDNQEQLTSILEIAEDSDSDSDSVDDILSMIAEAENISNGVNLKEKEEDPRVGDAFGDIMFKLTPVADKIIDKLMDKIRQKQYDQDQYMLGSAQGAEDDPDTKKFSSKVSKFFRKVGNGVVKVYVYGRDHYRSAKKSTKSIAKDIKHLFGIYYDEAKEYIHNKTSSDQADDENDSKDISKLMPNAKEFAKSFAVEMIKSISNGTKPSDETRKKVWAMLKNGVKAAFDMHANDTHGHHHNGNETELNEKIYDEFLRELNETIINEVHKLETQPEGMVGSTLNEDQVGDSLSIDRPTYVFDRFSPLIDYLSDKIVDKLQRQQMIKENEDEDKFYANISQASIDSMKEDKIGNDTVAEMKSEEIEKEDQLTSILEIADDSDSDLDSESVDDILSLIAEAENISNGVKSKETEEDPKVGDAFGDIMFKLTPAADKIIDKIMDKIRQKQYDDRNQYLVGSIQGAEDDANVDKFPSKISKFFQKVGNGVVKVYVYGRDHYRSAKKSTKSIATDIKHLYNVYYDEAKEYIHNKTSSDQADDANNENDFKDISKLMPNAKEFAKSFAVEMIKSISNGTKPSDETKKNVWAMLKNGVKAAFDMQANDTHGHHHNGNETELNEKIYNEFLHKLNETIINEEHKLETQPEGMVGSTLNEEQVGDSLSIDEPTYVFDRFTPLINYLSDKIVDKLLKQQKDSMNVDNVGNDTETKIETDDNQEQLTSILEIAENSDSDSDSVDDILSMIAEAENISNGVNLKEKEEDPRVGDAFGDIMFKLTPVADKIMDKLMDKIRQKQYDQDQYMLGSVQGAEEKDNGNDSAIASKVTGFFRQIGQSMVKVYTYGKDHIQSAKNLLYDAQFLYTTYYDNFIEDNKNDNKTYGPPPEHQINNEQSKKKQLEDQIYSIELKRELNIIAKKMPNSKKFAKIFAVELIKMLIISNNTVNNQNLTFWPVIRNAAKVALELKMHNVHANETDVDELIFKGFLTKLNNTIENDLNELNTNPELVGSVLGESMENETEDQLTINHFDIIFKKFTPLIDVVSDKIVTNLKQQQILEENDERQATKDIEGINKENAKESGEEKTQQSEESSVDVDPNLKMENPSSEIGCNRDITMEEFEKTLNEWHRKADLLLSMSPFGNAKESDETQKREKTYHLETTILSIPNPSLSSHHNGEIVAIRAGHNQQLLIAVSSLSEPTIKGNHDQIQIFEDVVDGKLFQTISCFKPRNLITFNINMDTVLAFIQNESEVKTYIFRGVQKFVEFTSFTMPSPIKQMIHNEIVTQPSQFLCPEHFLILVLGNQVEFMRAVTVGDCKNNEQLYC